ncbi:hypothetical protein COT47_02170 [Candidatus Woesearchaeota archaeon CG08_land_8_20_14_0_20_43_7]|nr:MAG: hypothetical protein COT47_02170 [Candidatus Woesearchaeota archaeon CG08_land_8_20_14_0_20_43_7]
MGNNSFEKEFIETGNWTDEQKDFINKLFSDIELALKDRFPAISQDMRINYELPKEGIGIKITSECSVRDEIFLGELDCRQHLDSFREYPKESMRMLATMLNNHVVSVYERVIMKSLSNQFSNLIQQSEVYGSSNENLLIAKEKKILQSTSIPEEVILMHPNTFQASKKGLKE